MRVERKMPDIHLNHSALRHERCASHELLQSQCWPHLEGEHELVALKQAEAGVVVDIKGQSLHNVAQTSLQAGCLPAGRSFSHS